MQKLEWLYWRRVNPFTLLGVVFLIPPTLCWAAITVALAGAGTERIWNFFSRIPDALQILILVICPLLGVVAELFALHQLRKEQDSGEAFSRLTIATGVTLLVMAMLASFRKS